MPKPVFYGFTEHINIKEKFTLKKKFRFAENPLSREETLLLRKHGTRLVALKENAIVSSGEDDRHFVQVVTNGEQPTTKLERAWLKYQHALEEEERLKGEWLAERKQSPENEEYLKSRF